MNERQMIRKLDDLRRQQEFFKEIDLRENKRTHAQIDLRNHDLQIKYVPDWEKQFRDKKLNQYLIKKGVKDPLETIVTDMFYHEIGHRGTPKYEGCPRTFVMFSNNFIDVIHNITEEKNKKKMHYFANCLTDIIDEMALKKINKKVGITNYAGTFMFDKEQGEIAKKKGDKFSKVYEASAKIRLYLYGDKQDRRLIKEFFTNDEKLNQGVINFLERTGLSSMKEDVYDGLNGKEVSYKPVKNLLRMREYLTNANNWEEITKIFTDEFWEYMDEMPQQSLFGSGGNISDDPNEGYDQEGQGSGSGEQEGDSDQEGQGGGSGDQEGQGSGSGDGDDDQDGQGGGSGDDDGWNQGDDEGDDPYGVKDDDDNKFISGDGFGDEMNDGDNKKKLIALKPGKGPGWMTNFEYLEGLYELLASDKVFELVTPLMESKIYPLVNINDRKFDYYDDSPSEIEGIDFDLESRGLELIAAKYKYNIEARVRKDVTNKPDLVFGLLDTSSSMEMRMPEGPGLGDVVNPKAISDQQWRYNSKYHVSLIAYFMTVQRFIELGIADADAYFANFSYETIVSRGLRQSKLEALHPQFGGTRITMSKINDLMIKKNNLIFTISDGEIGNDTEMFEKVKEVVQYNPYFHVQIGGESTYSLELKKLGVYVKNVQSEQELYEFVIDLTDVFYNDKYEPKDQSKIRHT
ncbi:hypothetical protein ACFL1H_08015 [Nanoarchaeota archaeon]